QVPTTADATIEGHHEEKQQQTTTEDELDENCPILDCPNRKLLIKYAAEQDHHTKAADQPGSPEEEDVTVTVLSLEVPVLKQSRSASIDASFLKVPLPQSL